MWITGNPDPPWKFPKVSKLPVILGLFVFYFINTILRVEENFPDLMR